jgi:hypothetical protein
MALGKQVGEFSFKLASQTTRETSSELNFQGTEAGFSTVHGT